MIHRHFGRLALAASFVVVITSCSDGFTRAAAVESFVEANPDASTDDAECVVDRLIETYELEGLEAELEARPVDPGFEEAQFRAMFGCGMTGDVEAALADQLELDGIEREKAECAANELVTVIEEDDLDVFFNGEINGDFYGKYFDSLASCDALPG